MPPDLRYEKSRCGLQVHASVVLCRHQSITINAHVLCCYVDMNIFEVLWGAVIFFDKPFPAQINGSMRKM